ncbi:MAG: hypothetical protein IID16_09380 [Candidatus Marinimicrobia bacterium]|nr:hypothetical protein [Candidatus Neomarinimicrobiota bacterium]
MIDFHNHVLPNVDDGPTSMEMSLSMLQTAAEQGITDVVNTVHYQHPKIGGKEVGIDDLRFKIEDLLKRSKKRGIDINIHLGAEVFYLPNLVKIVEDPHVTMGNGRYMLIEFPFHMLPDGHEQILFELKMKGITPIIAHSERYRPVQQNLEIVRNWIYSGCLIQVDGGSLLGYLGRSAKESAGKIISEGLCHIIGSDVHDDRRRNFCLEQAVTVGKELMGDQIMEMVTTIPEKILKGEPVEIEEIEITYHSPTFLDKIKRRFDIIWN